MAERSITKDARRVSLEYADRAFEHVESCRRHLKRGGEPPQSALDSLDNIDAALRRIVHTLTDEALASYRSSSAERASLVPARDFISPLAESDALLDSLVKVGPQWRSLRQLTASDCRVVASECRSKERAWAKAAHSFDVLRRTLQRYGDDATVGQVVSEEKLSEILGSSTRLLKKGERHQ